MIVNKINLNVWICRYGLTVISRMTLLFYFLLYNFIISSLIKESNNNLSAYKYHIASTSSKFYGKICHWLVDYCVFKCCYFFLKNYWMRLLNSVKVTTYLRFEGSHNDEYNTVILVSVYRSILVKFEIKSFDFILVAELK